MATAEEALLKEMTDRVSACYLDVDDGKLDCGEVLMIAVSYFEKVKAKTLSEKKELLIKLVSAALEKAVPAEQYERVGSKFVLDVLPTVLNIFAPAVAVKSWFSWLVPCFSAKAVKPVKAVSAKPSAVKVVAVKRSPRVPVASNDVVVSVPAPLPSPFSAPVAAEPPLPNSVDEKSPLV
jgi:hypothetical protein